MSRILAITGATGKKSGGCFAQILCEHIDEITSLFDGGIRVVVRETSSTSKLDSSQINFEKHIGSADDVEFLAKVFSDVDTVVHIAGIHWSKQVVDAAAHCRVRRLIVVHTTGIYSKYKQAGEEYRQIDDYVCHSCQKANIVLTILRPTMIYGNANGNNVIKFIKMVDKLPLMPVVNGARYELQPVHYYDLGEAYYQVLINESVTENKNFILSGGAPITLRDMFNTIGNVLGKKVHYISCPYFIAYCGAWLVYVFSFRKKDYREKVQRLCENRTYPYAEAENAFGYAPRKFEEGVVDEVKAYLEAKHQ